MSRPNCQNEYARLPDANCPLSGTDVLAYEVKIFFKRQNLQMWVLLIGIVIRKTSDREQKQTRVDQVYKLFAWLKYFLSCERGKYPIL